MSFLAPVLGLLVFGVMPFKPALTLYVLVVGLALVLRHAVEQARLAVEVGELVRRYLHGNHAH